MDLAFQFKLEEVTTSLAILSDFRVPIPLCSDVEFKLPGDGSIEAFALSLGRDASQMAVDMVLQQLALKVMLIIFYNMIQLLDMFMAPYADK